MGLTERRVSVLGMHLHALLDLGGGRAAPGVAGELPEPVPETGHGELAEGEGLGVGCVRHGGSRSRDGGVISSSEDENGACERLGLVGRYGVALYEGGRPLGRD